MDEIKLGPLTLKHLPAEGRIVVILEGQERGWTAGPDQWKEVAEVASDVTNLVPMTLLLTTMLDRGLVDEVQLDGLVSEIPAGMLHFRPSNRETHAVAREAVGRLLGVDQHPGQEVLGA